ncbi:uncharacterized protein [Oscarella lobularis]|uniref:uncharacterized protein isoform X2 n=1 Tax=Oscarella lobularis TaxID=121494 RepID=UPI0033134580
MTSKRRRLSYNARYDYEPIALLRRNATHHRRFYSKTAKNGLCSSGEVKRLSLEKWKLDMKEDERRRKQLSAVIGHLKNRSKISRKKKFISRFLAKRDFHFLLVELKIATYLEEQRTQCYNHSVN